MKKISLLFSVMLFTLQSSAQKKGVGIQIPVTQFSAHQINVSYYRQFKNGKRLNTWFIEPIIRIDRRKHIDTFDINPPIIYNAKTTWTRIGIGHSELFRVAQLFEKKVSVFAGVELNVTLDSYREITTSNQGVNHKYFTAFFSFLPKCQISYQVKPSIAIDFSFVNKSRFDCAIGLSRVKPVNIDNLEKIIIPSYDWRTYFSPSFNLSVGMRYKLWEKKEKIKKKPIKKKKRH